MLQNQGLLGIAFFEATALVVLAVLFLLFRRDHRSGYFGWWLSGWVVLTIGAGVEVALLISNVSVLRLILLACDLAAMLLFLGASIQYTTGFAKRSWPVLPLAGAALLVICYLERTTPGPFGSIRWETAVLESALSIWAGWLLLRWAKTKSGYGAQILAGALVVLGLHGMDRPMWPAQELMVLRVAFDHLACVALGIGMVVILLEGARERSEELSDKLKRLTLLTAASTQSKSVQGFLDGVLRHLVDSMGGTHGIVRLLEGEGANRGLVAKSTIGFGPAYLAQNLRLPATDPWAQRVLQKEWILLRYEEEQDPKERQRMAETGVSEIISLLLPGKEGPLGIVAVGSMQPLKFREDEMSYLVNMANVLGMTLQNVRLFEEVTTVQQQWAYTFDSICDPILVHDESFRIVRSNQRMNHLLGRESGGLAGRSVAEMFARKKGAYENCPYCEGAAGEGDEPDPWLQGYFLASNSTFTDPKGTKLGTVHALKDVTDRKRAEEKYRTLISNVQEGVFISTPQGRFLDFNDAFMRIAGYEKREDLLGVDIAQSLFTNPADRERLKKLLHEHGSVADFEFEMKRKDGETRAVMESSIAVRDAQGEVTAYQGFLLDITERKQAEQEIRRRNRELMVLNSIGQTLSESMDLGDSLHRTLRQMAELFHLDATSLYLFDEGGGKLKRLAAVGHRSEYARNFPVVEVQPELMRHIKLLHAKFLSAQGLPLPAVFRDAQRKEEIVTAYIVILWSKDRVIGGLVVGSRTARDFSPADINLLIAVGGQIGSAIERSTLFEETRQAYDNLRRTQEQLLHSEKMAAVGQLISGVAHELNNPLTAILGYSQLLISSGQVGPQGLEYSDKLYKQAQRTHRIVQNLLSFSRQHKPERVPVQLNGVLEEALALRDYDLRMSNIRLHLEFAEDLPVTSADPHQLQQVFLNLINNAVDAILDHSKEGDIWVRTGTEGDKLIIEMTDSGPGVKDSSKVFDPFYTTKPVGKGTGLGLSICYGIVTEHGGTIRVRNSPPKGATFRMEIPFQAASPADGGERKEAPLSGREGRILLIDGDESVLEAVGAVLRGKLHEVRAVKGPEEARGELERAEFDAVIADLSCADLTARKEFLGWLKARKPSLAERLILMRADTPESGDNIAENEAKKSLTLQKPFKSSELLSAVDAVLAEARTAPING